MIHGYSPLPCLVKQNGYASNHLVGQCLGDTKYDRPGIKINTYVPDADVMAFSDEISGLAGIVGEDDVLHFQYVRSVLRITSDVVPNPIAQIVPLDSLVGLRGSRIDAYDQTVVGVTAQNHPLDSG